MNKVFCVTQFCGILLTVTLSLSASVNLVPNKCALETKPIAIDGKKWTFCIQNTSDWSFDAKDLYCPNNDDVISIDDFQLYANDNSCPKDFDGFANLSSFNATCMQGKNKLLAKNLAKSILTSLSGKKQLELRNKTFIQSDLKVFPISTHRLVVKHYCHERTNQDLYIDICDNTTKREMTKIEIQSSGNSFTQQMNLSMCSCSIASTSDLTVIALDIRLHHSNELKLSPGGRELQPSELYWSKDANLVQSSTNLNITLTGFQTSFPESMWLKVTGTNMTIICQPVLLIHPKTSEMEDAKIDFILIIIIAAVSCVAIILFIILICCLRKYRRQKQRMEMCNSPTTVPLVLGKGHEEVVYSEPGKPVPSSTYNSKQNYFELENTYEEPTDPKNNANTDQGDSTAEESVYNHLRETPDLLPSNIYDTATKSQYSSFKRNEAGRHVIANDYDI